MGRRSGLGKGLDALIPSIEPDPAGGELRELPMGSIRANEYQPRIEFDEAALQTLAASITELGVLQPVLVRPVGDHFELIAGERRWRAAQVAGLETIPAVVRPVDDTLSLAQSLVENLQREDLNAIEEAVAYQQFVDEFGLDAGDIARRLGRSRPTIANTLRLLQLPVVVQDRVRERRLSAGHARALLPLEDPDQQVALADRVERDHLSVRALEKAVRQTLDGGRPDPEPKAAPARPASLIDLEDQLSERLATRVAVQVSAKERGRIVIEFAGFDDLDRLSRAIAPPTD